MIDLKQAVSTLAAIQPQALGLYLPAIPTYDAATPLAKMFAATARLPQEAAVLAQDVARVQRLLELIDENLHAAAQDIYGLANLFLREASQYLPYSMHIHPGVAQAAGTTLAQLPTLYVAEAMECLQHYETTIEPIVEELIAIAGHDDPDSSPPILEAASAPGERAPQNEYTESRSRSMEANIIPTSSSIDSGPAGSAAGARAVRAAESQLGTPYQWGGSAPGGYDCSGLTHWAWKQAGVDIPRTAAEQAQGRPLSRSELQPGDLVVWDGHVAMYAGDGQMIEAGNPVQKNPLRTTNMGMKFLGYYRPIE